MNDAPGGKCTKCWLPYEMCSCRKQAAQVSIMTIEERISERIAERIVYEVLGFSEKKKIA